MPIWALMLGLAIVVAATTVAYQRDRRLAFDRTLSGSTSVETPLGRVEYARKGVGPTVLVLHGAGGGFDQALDIGEPLVAFGFSILAPSRFGYLASSLPAEPSSDLQARCLAMLLERLGEDRVAVIGVSAGAGSALAFAMNHPEKCRALILLVPATGETIGELPVRLSALGRHVLRHLLRLDFPAWLLSKFLRPVTAPLLLATRSSTLRGATMPEKRRIDTLVEHILPVSRRRLGILNDERMLAHRSDRSLDSISCPMLLISCADDRFGTEATARHIASLNPRARFVSYPDGGHVLVNRHREALAAIADFLGTSTRHAL